MLRQKTLNNSFYTEPDSGGTRRFTTFALVRNNDSINVKIIGCFHLEQAPDKHPHIVGTIRIQDMSYPVIDEQIVAGMEPKTITKDSCIVLLNADESLSSFGTAVIVDDVTEVLSMAGGDS